MLIVFLSLSSSVSVSVSPSLVCHSVDSSDVEWNFQLYVHYFVSHINWMSIKIWRKITVMIFHMLCDVFCTLILKLVDGEYRYAITYIHCIYQDDLNEWWAEVSNDVRMMHASCCCTGPTCPSKLAPARKYPAKTVSVTYENCKIEYKWAIAHSNATAVVIGTVFIHSNCWANL